MTPDETVLDIQTQLSELRTRVKALEQTAATGPAPDPNEPHPGFLSAKAKARVIEERRKA